MVKVKKEFKQAVDIGSFSPLNNNLIVREIARDGEVMTENGILLDVAENMSPSVLFGEVVGAGKGSIDWPMPAKEGEKIAYKAGDKRYIYVNGEKLKVIDAGLLIGVYTE